MESEENLVFKYSVPLTLMTWLDDISVREKEAIEELRKRTINDVTPKMLEDPTLFYRFLKARNFNIKDAEAMLRKHILWRKDFGIDTILEDYQIPEVFKKYLAIGRFGLDKEGSPISYAANFKMDIIGLEKACKAIDFLKHSFWVAEKDMEILNEQNRKNGKFAQLVYIDDVVDISIAKATNKKLVEVIIEWLSMFQNNYPERIKRVYVVNAPSYFPTAFSILKLVITSGLMKKIQIIEPENVKETLLETIDADVLPAFLGGNRTNIDSDPLSKCYLSPGGLIPKNYYFSKKTIQQDEDVKYFIVTRRSQMDVTLDITDPGSILMWEFEIKSGDIRFGVCFKNPNDELVELIPKKRIETTWEPEMGMHVCESPGSYVLAFDNTCSWVFSKEIFYRTKIVPPATD